MNVFSKKFILRCLIGATFCCSVPRIAIAQLWAPAGSYDAKQLTNYNNGAEQDTVYFICVGETGTLNAEPESGAAPWDFFWYKYNSGVWETFGTNDLGVLSSSETGLAPGGYRVVVYDNNDVLVGKYIAWISRVTAPAAVNVSTLTPGCSEIDLVASVNWGSATCVYNPPSEATVLAGPDTEFEVCFSVTTSNISELSYSLIGPPSCGCPEVILYANYADWDTNGAGSPLCNNNNNVSDLCFSTESTNCLDICNQSNQGNFGGVFGLTGNLNSACTPIDWSPVFGCDLQDPSWTVRIVDAAFDAVPAVATEVSITINGNTTLNYSSAQLAALNNSLSTNNGFSQQYTPYPPCAAVAPTCLPWPQTITWTCTNATYQNNVLNGLTTLNNQNLSVPFTDATITLTIGGSVHYGLCGGDINDSEFFDFVFDGEIPVINPIAQQYCSTDPPVILTAQNSIPNGGWKINGVNIPGNSFDPSDYAGQTIDILYYVNEPCYYQTEEIQVEIVEFQNISITPVGPLCTEGPDVTLIASPSGGVWSGTGVNGNVFDPSVGTQTLTYTVVGACADTDQITVEVNNQVPVSVTGDNVYCLNDSPSQLSATPAGGTWGGTNNVNSNGLFTPSAVGTFVVNYSLSDGCGGSGSLNITVNGLPNVNLTPATAEICAGESVNLTATGAATYTWSGGTNPTTGSTVSASPATTTVVTVTGTDANQCQNTDNITITVNPLPVANIADVGPICQGDQVQLVATPTGLEYSWTNGNTLSANNISNPFANPNSTTTYTVTVTDQNDCSDTDDVTVTVIQGDASFETSPDEGLVPLVVTFTPNGTASQYIWDFGNGTGAVTDNNDPDPTATYEIMDYYTATLTIIVQGCEFSSSEQIFAYENSEIVTIPNVVTPNSDGLNDTYMVDARNMETFELHIFNRWGVEVGTINKPDGSWSPGDLSEGTYYFVLKAKGYDDKVYEREGPITILRK